MFNVKEYQSRLEEARKYIAKRISTLPETGIILGSGLGSFANAIEDKIVIPYQDIPNFPVSTVEGHAGQLVFGRVGDKSLVVMQGRFHYYEGYKMTEVVFPVRVMQALGVKGLIVTNAAGGINTEYKPGDLVLIKDHINLMGANPLRGTNLAHFGPRFFDMSDAYHKDWRETALKVAAESGLVPQEGVYAAVAGPNFETPAEIRYLRTIGADLVGMSTVPEVLVANHGGMKVLGISCVTNMAAGVLEQKLSHAEVMETGARIETQFVAFVRALVQAL